MRKHTSISLLTAGSLLGAALSAPLLAAPAQGATRPWIAKPAQTRSVAVTAAGHRDTFRAGPSGKAPAPLKNAQGSATLRSDAVSGTKVGGVTLRLQTNVPVGQRSAGAARSTTKPQPAAAAVRVDVAPQANGLVLRTNPASPASWSGKLTLGYGGESGAANAFDRLRVLDITSCLNTSTGSTVKRPPACTGKPVAAHLVSATHELSFPVSGSTARSFTVAAGPSGGSGDYSATSLAPSSSWSGGDQTGDFTWSYAIAGPPSAGGLDPDLTLSYDSSSVDGRVSSTNNQPSWVGEGFSLDTGHIDRAFASCDDDASGANNANHKTGDLCWKADTATIVLNGKATRLIKLAGANSTWRLKDDDGSRIEHKTGGANGDNDGEYWILTTSDGTQYYFGLTRRYSGDTNDTQSVWTVPVAGNNSGEPCYAASFADSFCNQAWRWNLDYVVDPHSNTVTYNYTRETNRYGQNLDTKSVSYDRGGYLRSADYGQVAGGEAAGNISDQIQFAVAERCTPSGSVTCDPSELTAATQTWWPDVPFDQICTSSTSCGQTRTSPTFFTRKRLTTITTLVRRSNGLTPVSSWTLAQSFPDPGDGTSAGLWLDSITRKGLVGGTTTLPPVLFGKGDLPLPNRVDAVDYAAPLNKYRLASIRTETGGTIGITYSQPDCVASSRVPSSPDKDTLRCFPSYWTPPGFVDPALNYFHTYLVTSVTEDSGITTSKTKVTNYSYVGAPAWHYDDDVTSPAKRRTWSAFRGYQSVDTSVGDVNEAHPMRTRTTYMRGMDGDKQADGTTRSASVTDSQGGSVKDSDQYEGFVREAITYNDAAVVTDTISTPWASSARASDAYGKAFISTQPQTVTVRTTVTGSSTPRITQASSTYDAVGNPLTVSDDGDLAVTGDERCTLSDYTTSSSKNILNTPYRVRSYDVACSVTNPDPSHTISDVHTYYDAATTLTAAPKRGDVTKTEQLADTGPGTTGYVTMATASYDTRGRTLAATDAIGRTTKTAYTPSDGQPTTSVTTTNPLNQASTVTLDPAFGAPTASADVNNKTTTVVLDPLGRKTKVWLPNRALTASPTYTYDYLIRANGPNAVTTTSLQYKGVDRITSIALYDGLLRPLQTQDQTSGTGRVLSDDVYDSRGLVVAARGPWFNGDANPSTDYLYAQDNAIDAEVYTTYDGAGRATKTTNAVSGNPHDSTTTIYNGDSTDVLPPTGGTATRTVTDARGHTTQLWQYHGNTITAAKDITRYTTNNKDQLTALTDPAGSTWTWTYDLLGRQIASSDPDKGQGTATYDLAGQQLTSTDARKQTLTYGYDDLGRKVRLEASTPTTPATVLATWTYDTVTGAIGQLASTSAFVDGAEYKRSIDAYNSLYEPTQTTTTVPASATGLAGTYVRKNGYNVDGSVATSTMPAAPGLDTETWSIRRDAVNRPLAMGANETIVGGSTRDAFGDLTQYVLSAQTGKSVTVSTGYDTGLHRVTSLRVDRDNVSGAELNATYGYDLAGNITSIADVPDPANAARTDRQCFQYDYLRRLTQAWSNGSTACSAAPSYVASGAAPYWSTWAYDAAGNRVSENRHAATSTNDTVVTSTYPAPTSARPHAPTSISTKAGAASATTASLTYDDAGNTTATPLNGVNAALNWNEQGRLDRVTTKPGVNGRNIYDADGDLLIKTASNGARTLYLGDTEITYTPASGTTPASTASRRIFTFDGIQVATRTSADIAGLTFTPPNPQGTASVQINASTAATAKRYFTPFGAGRGIAPPFIGDHGFLGSTGATTDAATGLTHLGARDYDPAQGRFLSPDPLLDLANPQQYNAYAYADQSPITKSDPSGLMVDPGTGGGFSPNPKHHKKSSPAHYKAPGPTDDQLIAQYATKATNSIDVSRDFWMGAGMGPQPIESYANPWSIDGHSTCFGRLACQKAYDYLQDNPDDVYSAKLIAASFCFYNQAACVKDAQRRGKAEAVTQILGIVAAIAGGPALLEEVAPSAVPRAAPGLASGEMAGEPLDWSIVSKAGESRAAHVALHEAENASKAAHGVFLGNSQALTNEAWSIVQERGIVPITERGVDIYSVPMGRNVGYAGGANAGEMAEVPHRTIEIITRAGTNQLITAYPVPLG